MRAMTRRSQSQDPCAMAGLGVAAHHGLARHRAFGSHRIADLVHLPGERLGAGEAEHVIDAVMLAPAHRLRAGVMAVAAEGDVGLWPAPTDAANETAQMRVHLDAAWRLAGAQDDGDRSAAFGVVDVDRQKAMFVIVGVEQLELLMTVHHVYRVVDVERDRARCARVAVHPDVDERIGQPDRLAKTRCILHGAIGLAVSTDPGPCPAAGRRRA